MLSNGRELCRWLSLRRGRIEHCFRFSLSDAERLNTLMLNKYYKYLTVCDITIIRSARFAYIIHYYYEYYATLYVFRVNPNSEREIAATKNNCIISFQFKNRTTMTDDDSRIIQHYALPKNNNLYYTRRRKTPLSISYKLLLQYCNDEWRTTILSYHTYSNIIIIIILNAA